MAVSHAQLRAFHAVAQTGSFTRAAERLFLSQPAVSDQVRKLEEQYGVLLFNRTKRTVQLTELGERLLGITQRLYAVAAEAQELLSSSRALQTGSLTLAVDSPVHVLPFIGQFNDRYPGIRFNVVTGNTDEALARLFAYQADFAVLGRPIQDEALVSVVLSSSPLLAFVAADHPLAARESIVLADLDDQPLVLRERGSMTRQLIELELQREGLRLRSAIEVEGREAVFETVAGGLGIGIVSAAEFGSSRSLHALPILDCRQRMTETMVCLREQSSRRIIETFLELVRSNVGI
ncbi:MULTISPECIES: LysR substrate-binding domain-containing protein [Pseudomonadaceae]|uniref:LysR family transcriptional regulator n=2 Tax=Pseudomonadaceae TaxID=135621 RepID=A0A1I5VIQ3_9GAMM|nr:MULTISPECIES: LysR substrate-binding domain-containing protein [Pseudomonas]AQZ32295.1 LysR family transcriptional regulator [Pseudomonas sp. LPH1]PIA72754.1 LysR family transcriptional regulator [Pseudomonas toyotomiensis]QNH02186.1 LysR family transcriptional regulator [Pseudomonas sediminis]QSL93945.1 LysR family transcriptional regulator [Pseudomonas toyotomiensis]SDA81763.1 aminoethylphosphonate catabolism associated LysR family transcriptional regulator [Pseudomonas sp. NFPP33]